MTLTLAQRRQVLASIPWVAHSPKGWPERCQGWKSGMPLYARRAKRNPEMHDDPMLDKWRCHNRANWVHLSLDGDIVIYCWWHLFTNGFQGDPEENERYQAWVVQYMEDHPEPEEWHVGDLDMPPSRR